MKAMAGSGRLAAFLEENGRNFDPHSGLIKIAWQGPGYHTRVPNGTMASPTRDNLSYALALLASADGEACVRAASIIGKILRLQELDPAKATYGIWPWLVEEPLERMNPPDWNWADFCGIRLAHALVLYSGRLSGDLQNPMRKALHAAAYSIFRRNVGPVYTNIAIKGAVVAAVAGEILGDPLLLEYAARRLGHFLDYTEEQGGFTEYNSPPYGVLVLTEVERGLLLVKDGAVREKLSRVHRLCWEMFARSLHRPTGQVCGPHARAYHDLLTEEIIAVLEEGLGEPLVRSGAGSEGLVVAEHLALIPRVPCPPDVRNRIYGGRGEIFSRHEYKKSTDPARRREASFWMGESACLGTLNSGILWTQQRPVMGYWKAEGGTAVLRVRMLKDGRDFAAGTLRTCQEHGETLVLASLATNKGDFHDTLDRPEGGVFKASKLCVSVEISGAQVWGNEVGEGAFFAGADGWGLCVRPVVARFSGWSPHWELVREEGSVLIQAVLLDGDTIDFCPGKMSEAVLGFHMVLCEKSGGCPDVKLSHAIEGGDVILASESVGACMEIRTPLKPGDFV